MTKVGFLLNLEDEEISPFFNILPLARITASDEEKKAVRKMLGISNHISFAKKAGKDMVLAEQYAILLYLTHLRNEPEALNNFFKRMLFLDKKLEQRVRDMLWIEDAAPSPDTLSDCFDIDTYKDL